MVARDSGFEQSGPITRGSHRRRRLCVQLRQRFGAVHRHLVRRCGSHLCFHRGATRTSVPALVIFAHGNTEVLL